MYFIYNTLHVFMFMFNIIIIYSYRWYRMTIQQLKYAVAIEKYGSLSKAARKVHISQPSLSASIKELENELRIQIFRRSNRGITLTAAGAKILSYARSILRQCDEVSSFAEKKEMLNFTVASVNSAHIIEAFIRIAKGGQDNSSYSYELINTDNSTIINMIHKQEADIGVFFIETSRLQSLLEQIEELNIRFLSLGEGEIGIRVRSGHPICAITDEKTRLKQLGNYPFVYYRSKSYKPQIEMYEHEEYAYINQNRRIIAFDRDAKNRIINESDGFTIGTRLHPNFSRYYDQVFIPLENQRITVGYIMNTIAPLNPEIERFATFLREELRTLIVYPEGIS